MSSWSRWYAPLLLRRDFTLNLDFSLLAVRSHHDNQWEESRYFFLLLPCFMLHFMFGWSWPSLMCTHCRKCSFLLKCIAADVEQALAAAFHGWPASVVGRHNSTLKLSLSDAFQKLIYCIIWLNLGAFEDLGCYRGKETGYLYEPSTVLSFWLSGFTTKQFKDTRVIIRCVLYRAMFNVWPWLSRCLAFPCL